MFAEFSKYPAVLRDLSLVVDQSIDYKLIESAIHLAGIPEVQRVFPFDLYLGDRLPPNKKGISISIVFQGKDRTLLEEEINRYQERILDLLRENLGAQLRS